MDFSRSAGSVKLPLPIDLHANHAVALRVRRFDLLYHRRDVVMDAAVPVRHLAIRVTALRIHAHQMHFGPIAGGGGAQRGQRMAGNTLGADPFLLLGLVEGIHDALPFVSPGAPRHAMDEHAVNVVRIECLAVVVNRGQRVVRLAVDFGLNEKFFARQSLDGIANPGERA